jgi:TolB-like protein/DNA-binding winged helix-turn-helix (wHTH) protein/Flp pilus assembly protein TadD
MVNAPIPIAGDAALDLDRECLLQAGKPVHLRKQTFDVLRCLAEQRGRLVTKERFIEDVWRGRAVTDGSLGKCIEELREALGPEAAACVRTVRGRGYILETADVETAAPASRATARSNLAITVGLAAIVVSTAAFVYFARSAALHQPIKSVAVMPFANETGDSQFEYLSDGTTEQMIDRLSRLSGLRVMAQSAVMHYKGREVDARTIGRQLGVEAVLVGRLAKRGDSIGLTLELIDARDNRHIWGDEFERTLPDLPALAREIPEAVSLRLRPMLNGERTELGEETQQAGNADAYQLYLKGRYSWEKWTVDGSKQAIAYFTAAIEKDPGYALAYAGLADAYIFGNGAGAGLPSKEAHRRARLAADKALSLDPRLAETHAALAEVLIWDDWDFAGGERELRRALELNPNYPEAHHQYSHLLLMLGRNDESLRESRIYLELDPVSETPTGHLAWHYVCTRQFDAAIAQSLKDLQLYPDAPQDLLEDAYYAKGMFQEAVDQYFKERGVGGHGGDTLTATETADLRAAFAAAGINGFLRKRLAQLMSVSSVDRNDIEIAAIHARLGAADQAFQYLDLAYARHADLLVLIKEDVRFDAVRGDPRFTNLLRRIGLPQ